METLTNLRPFLDHFLGPGKIERDMGDCAQRSEPIGATKGVVGLPDPTAIEQKNGRKRFSLLPDITPAR